MRTFRYAAVLIKIVGLVSATLAAASLVAPMGASAQESTAWYFCALSKSPYGEPTFYSSVFRADRSIYQRALENSFNSFVSARFDSDAISGANCIGPVNAYQDAVDQENDLIAGNRRSGKSVVLTRWAYRGD